MAIEELSIKVEKVTQSRLNEVDFNALKFGREFSDHMLVADYENGSWGQPSIQPYGKLAFAPSSSVFHYGQAIFEGMKAYRSADDRILLFRPDANFSRFNNSAVRMSMAEVPEHIFMDGIKQLVELDSKWVPKGDGQALYIRPFMIADDEFIGVKASNRYKFMIITSPTAGYYSGAVSVKVEEHYARACEGGIGAAKAAANYAASLLPAAKAQAEGYDQLIWTDSKTHQFIEESGTMNIMFVIGDTLLTPSLDTKTILPGITRDSILTLARDWGMKVEERQVSVKEIIEAHKSGELKEAFGAGTAATIAPISRIGYNNKDYALSDFTQWEFSNKAKATLEGIKRGKIEDKFGWNIEI
jgi:branched-chain amino acid aminotransferase